MSYKVLFNDGTSVVINNVSYMSFAEMDGINDWMTIFFDGDDEMIQYHPVSTINNIKLV